MIHEGGSKINSKIFRFLFGIKFAIILLLIIAAYSIIGTLLPQGLSPETYQESYHSMGTLILFLQLDQAYSSILFRLFVVLFLINIIGCTLKNLPGQRSRMKGDFFLSPREDGENHYTADLNLDEFRQFLLKKRYRVVSTEEGYRASKHRIGFIGSSVTHLGIVIIILGSFFGNLLSEEGFFYLLPGETKHMEEYGFSLHLDDFSLGFREDGSIEQYYSDMTVLEGNETIKKDTMWVNNPLTYKNIHFYQTSYGWASRLAIKDADGKEVYSGMLKNGETYFYEPLHLTVYLYGYFPNLNMDSTGLPFTMTEQENNPYYAFILYLFNDQVGAYVVEPGQSVTYEGMEITFDDSALYTGITYRKEHGFYFVLLGSILLLMGLIFSFYFYPKYIFVENGSIRGAAKQNLWGWNQQLARLIRQMKQKK